LNQPGYPSGGPNQPSTPISSLTIEGLDHSELRALGRRVSRLAIDVQALRDALAGVCLELEQQLHVVLLDPDQDAGS
jgi:hypothetical protein